MEVTLRREREKTVAEVKGRLDAVSAPAFEKELLASVGEGERWVVLDFSELEYISSAGLRSILAVAKRIRTQNGELSVAALREEVRKVFELSGFSTLLPVFETVGAATARR